MLVTRGMSDSRRNSPDRKVTIEGYPWLGKIFGTRLRVSGWQPTPKEMYSNTLFRHARPDYRKSAALFVPNPGITTETDSPQEENDPNRWSPAESRALDRLHKESVERQLDAKDQAWP
jgi:hypothetical protein